MTKPEESKAEESKAEESKAEESLALIHAFLDGGATAEECALLDQKLAADPQFAQAFCDAAETDVLLAELWSQRQEKEVAKSVLSQIDRQGAAPRATKLRFLWPALRRAHDAKAVGRFPSVHGTSSRWRLCC